MFRKRARLVTALAAVFTRCGIPKSPPYEQAARPCEGFGSWVRITEALINAEFSKDTDIVSEFVHVLPFRCSNRCRSTISLRDTCGRCAWRLMRVAIAATGGPMQWKSSRGVAYGSSACLAQKAFVYVGLGPKGAWRPGGGGVSFQAKGQAGPACVGGAGARALAPT